jgi:hypothetical protein
LFYVDGALKTGLTIPYRIFDINADSEAAADLTEVAGGFYYADASLIESSLDLFFRAENIAYEFDLLDSSIVAVSGGILIGGVASELALHIPAISGGVVIGGVVQEELIPGVSGGVLVGGGALLGSEIDIEIGGGVNAGGHAALIFDVEVGGGILVGGVPETEDLFFNKDRNQSHSYSIGDEVYLRYDSKNNLPSRYERHTVGGLRFFGESRLYDVGIGILVDESLLISDLNIDVVRSDEASESMDWANSQTQTLEDTIPLPNPTGGILSETHVVSDGGVLDVAKETSFSEKKAKIEATTPLPDPVGGIVYVSDTFNPVTDNSKIVNRLKALKEMTPLPDPVGGTVINSSTSSERFAGLADKIQGKLAALRNASAIPAPTGGAVMVSHTEGSVVNKTVSIQKKLDELRDVALLPDPSGAYILVSTSTEGVDSLKSVYNETLEKITQLGIQAADEALKRTGAGV